jgi:hypothetical protein
LDLVKAELGETGDRQDYSIASTLKVKKLYVDFDRKMQKK